MANNIGGQVVPRITRAEHIGPDDTGDNIEAKRVANYVWNGVEWHRLGSPLTDRYDYDDSTTIYTAQAVVGTADASTGWIITRYDLTDTNNASGKIATDVSWLNRASGTYL